eukprot:scaffold70938_cov62-Phaeocystis_antarctica.AAC.4
MKLRRDLPPPFRAMAKHQRAHRVPLLLGPRSAVWVVLVRRCHHNNVVVGHFHRLRSSISGCRALSLALCRRHGHERPQPTKHLDASVA